MDLCGSRSKLSVLNFYIKYQKELKRKYDRANSLFGAWMTITCAGLIVKRKKGTYLIKSVKKEKICYGNRVPNYIFMSSFQMGLECRMRGS